MKSTLRQAIENLPGDLYDLFAMHRFDHGISNNLRVELRPIEQKPASSHSLPIPINFKEGITVESILLHKYGEPLISASSFYAPFSLT